MHVFCMIAAYFHVIKWISVQGVGVSSTVKMPLSCKSTQRIHVVSEVYGNRSSGQGCQADLTDTCTKLNKNDSLIVNCNGRQNCTEIASVSDSSCVPQNPVFEVNYECVKESKSICKTFRGSVQGPVYLHSTDFPDSAGLNGNCSCIITGKSMTALVIESHDNVIITKDSTRVVLTGPHQYNKIIAEKARKLIIPYNTTGNGINTWYKVWDTGSMSVSCSGTLLPVTTTTVTSTLSSSTVQLSTSTKQGRSSTALKMETTEAMTTNQHNETTILPPTGVTSTGESTVDDKTPWKYITNTPVLVAAVYGGVVVSISLIILALVWFKVAKPPQNKPDTCNEGNDNRDKLEIDDSRHHYEDVMNPKRGRKAKSGQKRAPGNTYTDLCTITNTDQNEYGKLKVNGTKGNGGKPTSYSPAYCELADYSVHGGNHHYDEIKTTM